MLNYFIDKRIPEIDGRRPVNITLEEWNKLSPKEKYTLIFGESNHLTKQMVGMTWD